MLECGALVDSTRYGMWVRLPLDRLREALPLSELGQDRTHFVCLIQDGADYVGALSESQCAMLRECYADPVASSPEELAARGVPPDLAAQSLRFFKEQSSLMEEHARPF